MTDEKRPPASTSTTSTASTAPTSTAATSTAAPEPVFGPVTSERALRLFVGARVSVQTASAIAAAAQTIARRAREAGIDLKWVPPANYHVTLKFLGPTRASAVGAIRDALERACANTPVMKLTGARIGAFPSADQARVIWAGIGGQGADALAALAKRIDEACAGLGWAPEIRNFHPHVTIARARESRPLGSVVLPMAEQMFGDTRLDAVILFESRTDSKGSQYREIHRIDFKQAGSTPETALERQSRPVDLGTPSREPVRADREVETDDGWPRGQGPAD